MLIVIIVVIFYINNRINNYDLSFYVGKDDGIITRIKSVCLLSILFFGLIAEKQKVLMMFLGLIAGIISCILSYILWALFFIDGGLSFHIIACIIFMAFYIVIDYKVKYLKTS